MNDGQIVLVSYLWLSGIFAGIIGTSFHYTRNTTRFITALIIIGSFMALLALCVFVYIMTLNNYTWRLD